MFWRGQITLSRSQTDPPYFYYMDGLIIKNRADWSDRDYRLRGYINLWLSYRIRMNTRQWQSIVMYVMGGRYACGMIVV